MVRVWDFEISKIQTNEPNIQQIGKQLFGFRVLIPSDPNKTKQRPIILNKKYTVVPMLKI